MERTIYFDTKVRKIKLSYIIINRQSNFNIICPDVLKFSITYIYFNIKY